MTNDQVRMRRGNHEARGLVHMVCVVVGWAVDGKLNCTVECSPLLGPGIFDAIEAITSGKQVPKKISMKEQLFEQENAKELIKSRQY